MDKRSKTVVAVAAVAAVSATAAALLWRRRGAHDVSDSAAKQAHGAVRKDADDDLFAAPVPAPATRVTEAATVPATAAVAASSVTSPATLAPRAPVEEPMAVLDKVLEDMERSEQAQKQQQAAAAAASVATKAAATATPPAAVKPAAVTTPSAPPASDSSIAAGKEVALERLGVTLRLPEGWEATREFAPSPNIVIVSLSNPEWGDPTAAPTPGQVPIIALTAEDIHMENLTLGEFNERSKEVSMQQLLMLTYGTIQPSVRRDEAISVGPFRHIIEYVQSTPPLFNMCVTSLSTMRDGVAYVLQMTSSLSASQQHRDTFMQLARNVQLTSPTSGGGDGAPSYIEVCTGAVCVHIDTAWEWQYGDKAVDGDADNSSGPAARPLAIFHHASSTKRERVALYARTSAPAPRGNVRSTRTVDDVEVTSRLVDGARETKVCTFGDYTLVVTPLQKAVSYVPESMLAAVLKSVVPAAAASSTTHGGGGGARFVAADAAYSFDMLAGSHVVASVLNPSTIIYIPHGSISELQGGEVPPEQRGPLVTVRVGTPADEPDCMATLEEWRTRVQSDDSLGSISDLRETTLKGERCLTFQSTAMQEVGPNTQLQMREAVYIFCRDGVSTVLRWEVVAGQWRKYERHLQTFIDSFAFAAQTM